MRLKEGTIIPLEDGDLRVKHDVEIPPNSYLPSEAFEWVDGRPIVTNTPTPKGLGQWLLEERNRQRN